LSAEVRKGPQLTDDQRRAVEWQGGELLVAAAAGSGKTTVLVERFVWLVNSGKADPENLPTLTFTEKAAEQLKRRVRRRFEELGAGRGILRALDGAYISTIHGFCRRLLRENYQLAGIDPSFLVIPEEECKLLRRQALEEIFDDLFGGVIGDDSFLQQVSALCDNHGGREFDAGIQRQVLSIHSWLMKQVAPQHWMEEIRNAGDIRPTELPGFKAYAQLLSERLNMLSKEYLTLVNWSSDETGKGAKAAYAKNIDVFLGELERISKVSPMKEPEKFLDMASGLKAPAMYGKPSAELKAETDRLKEQYFNRFKALIGAPLSEGAPETTQSHLDISVLVKLTELFIERYERLKARRWGMDFDDLQHRLLKVLVENPEVGKGYRERFKYLLVDEFQDNNRLQEAILRELCTPDGLFMVGDGKQAIYRFRGAEPYVFIENEAKLAAHEDGGVVRLKVNFRSLPAICSAVNALFAPLFTGGASEIDYGQGHHLEPHRDSYATGDPVVEFHIIGSPEAPSLNEDDTADEADDRETVEVEAQWTARRVDELIKSGEVQILREDGSLRPAGYGDVVVLLRAMVNRAQIFSKAFKQLGIPHLQAGAGGFLDEQEIRDMRSLLRVIDNPLQDIPFAAAMRSPFSRVDAGDLYRIRHFTPDADSLYGTVLQFIRDGDADGGLLGKISSFLTQVDYWRSSAPRLTPAELIADILRHSSYADYVLGLDGGRVQRANLERLVDIARDAVPIGEGGLRKFLGYLDELEAGDYELKPGDVPEVEGAVMIMSIHSAKGLEFPVVVVPSLGKKFNDADIRGELIFDDEFGPIYEFTDVNKGYARPTYDYIAAKERMRARSRAEELRILYVAFTRAREKLIVSGTADLSRFGSYLSKELTSMDIYASSPMEWFVPVLAGMDGFDGLARDGEHFDGPSSIDVCGESGAEIRVGITPAADVGKIRARGEGDNNVRELIGSFKPLPTHYPEPPGDIEPILAAYPYIWATRYEDKLTAGRLETAAPFMPFDEAADYTPVSWDIDDAVAEEARQAGKILHRAFELLDFTMISDPLWADNETQKICSIIQLPGNWDNESLTVAMREMVASPLGPIIAGADEIWRERSFSLKLPLAELARDLEPRSQAKDWVMLQGRFDLVCVKDGKANLVDYKSDSVPVEFLDERVKQYIPQLAAYAEALRRIAHVDVESWLFFIRHGKAVNVTTYIADFGLSQAVLNTCCTGR